MELEERMDILIQAANLAQKAGVLSLEDASIALRAIESYKEGKQVKSAANILVAIANKGYEGGVFTMKDAHLIYSAIEDIDLVLPE